MADKMTRCPEGHFYDPARHGRCPWCALPPDVEGEASPSATKRAGGEIPGAKNDPVVGWLVCLAGPDHGRDFRLHAEKNFVGRSPLMDVCVADDDTVSRERHALVIFDPKKQAFWAAPGEASGLVYLNGDIVHFPTRMQCDDVLEVGRTKLVLIPFCGEKYSWSREFSTAAPPSD